MMWPDLEFKIVMHRDQLVLRGEHIYLPLTTRGLFKKHATIVVQEPTTVHYAPAIIKPLIWPGCEV